MVEFVEPSVRRVVADRLGVGVEVLVRDISLRDDLAADSLDLVELAMALETEFAIVVPERIVDRVRTYGDLVEAIGLLVPQGDSDGGLERTGRLTPYAA